VLLGDAPKATDWSSQRLDIKSGVKGLDRGSTVANQPGKPFREFPAVLGGPDLLEARFNFIRSPGQRSPSRPTAVRCATKDVPETLAQVKG
jgi:hypothetical protein